MGGAGLARRFLLKFKGEGNIGAQSAATALASLREEDPDSQEPKWKELWAKGPSGSDLRVYVGPDKSPKQERTEILSKRLAGILKPRLPTKDVFARRVEGVITIDWVPMVRVEVVSQSEVQIKWNKDFETENPGINKGEILEAFNSNSRGPPIEWV